jgi:hypothetical protein
LKLIEIIMKSPILRVPLLLFLFSLLLVQGCKDDEEVYPQVQTLELTALSPSSATLKGNILSRGSINVLDHGFIYGFSPELSDTRGARVSLGKDVQEGTFTTNVTGLSIPNGYYYDRMLYARAYITNEKGTVFGQVANVILPSPNVQGIVPASGKAGDRVTINGQFFTNSTNEVEVTFNNISAKVVEVTASKIVVEVPVSIPNNYYGYNQVPVVLKMANQSYTVTSNFQVIPTVKDFTPKSGTLGTSITITGDNLPSSNYYYNSIRVFMDQVEVSVSSYYSGGIQVTVPGNVSTEKVTLSVLINGVTTVLPGQFTVTPHTVSSISPASGLSGSTFSVFGSNFPANPYYSNSNISVKLGDTPASVDYVSSGQLTVTVPNDLPAGDYKVWITAGPHTVEAPQQYKVLTPSITGFSPVSGGIGREVTINGVFLPNRYYTVYFGSVSTEGYSTSSTSLRVQVPSGVAAGSVKVYLQHGNQKLEAKDEFTVLAPSITSFSPTSGVAGSVVTITGAGFTPNSWTTVKFGTITTSILSISENTIRAVVPSGVTGAMKINVIHNGQTLISNDNFTVTN